MPFAHYATDSLFAQLKATLESLTSPVAGDVLFHDQDEFGPVRVLQQGDFRTLCFDEVFEQSKMRLSAPHEPVFGYIRAMLLAGVLAPSRTALVLGLGGGSLVRSLAFLRPECAITAVEIRPLVLQLAQQYFALSDARCQFVCADASAYLAQLAPQTHDVIFADLYWSLLMDQQQKSSQFIELCRSRLTEQGWLALNMASRKDVDDNLLQLLYRSFDDVLSCTVPNGNTVLLAGSLQQSGGLAMFYQRLAQDSSRWHGALDGAAKALQRVVVAASTAI